MISSDTLQFDFLSEIKKENHYNLLFPKKEVGLAIAWLYQKILNGTFFDGTFKESDIHEALDKMHPGVKNPDHRKQIERYNIIVSDLQNYFIRYDEEKQVYYFKEYGNEFYKQALDTLKANFDPTQIEKICIDLKKDLLGCSTGSAVKDWIEIKFSTFKPKLKHQIDYLERQIDKSVQEIRRSQITKDNTSILETLKEINERFDQIRTQNKELNAAFRELHRIKQLLEEHAINIEDKDLGDNIFSAQQFVQEMKRLLGIVDQRLDRIQPKVRQLFATLNKPLFNTRIEQFLVYLLEYSKVETEQSKKVLKLPAHIPEYMTYRQKPKFTIVERKKDLFPSKAKKKRSYLENADKKKKAYEKSRERFRQQSKVDLWLNQIKKDLQQKDEVSFAPYFYRAYNDNDRDLELAVALAYRVLQEHRIYGWRLNFDMSMVNHIDSDRLRIRQMSIQKKFNETV